MYICPYANVHLSLKKIYAIVYNVTTDFEEKYAICGIVIL